MTTGQMRSTQLLNIRHGLLSRRLPFLVCSCSLYPDTKLTNSQRQNLRQNLRIDSFSSSNTAICGPCFLDHSKRHCIRRWQTLSTIV